MGLMPEAAAKVGIKLLDRIVDESSLIVLILIFVCVLLLGLCVAIYKLLDHERNAWKDLAMELKNEMVRAFNHI